MEDNVKRTAKVPAVLILAIFVIAIGPACFFFRHRSTLLCGPDAFGLKGMDRHCYSICQTYYVLVLY